MSVKAVKGTFNGTGATAYICIGFVPDKVKLYNLESATVETVEWLSVMGADTLTCEGLERPKGGGAVLDYAFGEGVAPYYGGDLLTTTNQTSVTYGEGVYLGWDHADYRYFTNAAAGITGDAATTDITTWTLDTAATPTGHFNGDVTGTYIGDGSLIRIRQGTPGSGQHVYEAYITALTAGQGVSSDEVTLSQAVPTGKVEYIGGKYSMAPIAVGKVTPAGFVIKETTVNANNGIVAFEAWKFN